MGQQPFRVTLKLEPTTKIDVLVQNIVSYIYIYIMYIYIYFFFSKVSYIYIHYIYIYFVRLPREPFGSKKKPQCWLQQKSPHKARRCRRRNLLWRGNAEFHQHLRIWGHFFLSARLENTRCPGIKQQPMS